MAKMTSGSRKQKNLHPVSKQDAEAYLLPELENLKAFLSKMHLKNSLMALLFLERIVEYELQSKFHHLG